VIANARMYAVSSDAAEHWRTLLMAISREAGVPLVVIEHAAPDPIEELWRRPDQGAVFMCGLPYSLREPAPALLAAPVPSPAEFAGKACYWSDLVVRADSRFRSVQDTFGGRLALTVRESQSGHAAALGYFIDPHAEFPLFDEITAPTITPLGALSAVIAGEADIAPIDAYALRLLRRYRPELTAQVRVIGQTVPTPIPPIVASSAPADALQAAFLEAHEIASIKPLLEPLLLQRFVRPEPGVYDVLRERYATARQFWIAHPLARITPPAFDLG
jgi:ABC-type phosphate/phosphonate transport system substrate-binding protein